MSDGDFVTHGQLKDKLENISLRVSEDVGKMIDLKFAELLERFDKAQINSRDSVVMQITGMEFEERPKIKQAIQHAYEESEKAKDTKATVKKATIGAVVTAFISAGVSGVVVFWKG